MNGQPNITDRLYSDLLSFFHGGRSLSKEAELELKDQIRASMADAYKEKMASQWYHDAKLRG